MLHASAQAKHPSHKAALTATLLLTAAIAVAVSLIPFRPAAANIDDPDSGQHLYGFYGCIDCHGVNAEGDIGPRIAGYSDLYEVFLQQLRSPREDMDPYPDDFLSDDQASDLYTYLKTLP